MLTDKWCKVPWSFKKHFTRIVSFHPYFKILTLYKVHGVISIYCKIIKDHQISVSTIFKKKLFPYNFCAQHGTSWRNLENFIDSYEMCSSDLILKD
jgi:hypothetical protein